MQSKKDSINISIEVFWLDGEEPGWCWKLGSDNGPINMEPQGSFQNSFEAIRAARELMLDLLWEELAE